ncbi:hypothetical protein [Brevibacterium limosum]|uniref:hypothetical protein n=1 Tax=Brevibacterium limosum TaxID=2697565 RepID=UPI0014216D37|nr:hypothetical protein [Brevibacterium limosum]
MDVIHQRAAGIDISKRDAKVAIRAPGKRRDTYTTHNTTWAATTSQILALRGIWMPDTDAFLFVEAS